MLNEEGAFSIAFENAGDDECFDAALPSEPDWERQKLTALFGKDYSQNKILTMLSCCDLIAPPSITTVEDENWERRWLDQFEPIQICADLWICPSWLEPPEPGATNLIIDPGLAFGTGTHPTTHLCLEYLAETPVTGKTVVDYGCGSGILAIGALALGAERAFGLDVDPKALDASKKNAEINGVSAKFVVDYPDNIKNLQADIVIANILADTLIELFGDIDGLIRNGGLLLLSGILAHQEKRIINHYAAEYTFSRRQKQDWILLIGIKNSISQ